jgi:hypothetical protein
MENKCIDIINVANSYLVNNNIGQSDSYNSDWLAAKKIAFGWNDAYATHSYFTEIVWKDAYGIDSKEWELIDRLFSPSPLATHTNFRGSKHFRTGTSPSIGALAIWRNGWHSYMGIVSTVYPDEKLFDMIIGQWENGKVRINLHIARNADTEYKKDGYNLVGFVYPKECD